MGTYLQRANSSPSSQKKFTVSTWVKVCREGGDKYMWSMRTDDSNWIGCRFAVNGCIILQVYTSGSTTGQLQTNAFFRDFSAWYHVVVAVDTTQSTAGDRLKLYVNGSQETSFSTTTNPSLNADIPITSNFQVATSPYSSQYSSNSLDGYLAQFIYADNQAYSPSTFGSTNTNGIWIPNSSPSVTYGNNGFKLDFAGTGTAANASGFGADSSGNGNHFASNSLGTNPSTTDTCQNNFATLNIRDERQSATFTKGALEVVTNSSNRNYVTMTQATKGGKWYLECKFSDGAGNGYVGFCDMNNLQMSGTSTLGDKSNEARVNSDGSYEIGNSTTSGWAGSFTDNDILGLALDCDNNRFTLSKNGQWADGSGNYDEANPTAYITYTAGNFMSFAFGEGAGGATATIEVNAGQPIFTISSSNSDANGEGSFEYAVPSGYYALCTNNLAAHGG